MESTITSAEKEEMEAYIKEHPIDPQHDWLEDMYDDTEMPLDEACSRFYRKILKDTIVKD